MATGLAAVAFSLLTARDRAGLERLVGGNAGFEQVVVELVKRQRRSLELAARADAALAGAPPQLPYEAPLLPVCVERAQGAVIVDVDGNEYVDCHMAYTASVLGHNPPPVLEAVRAALARGLQGGHFFAEQVELAELVQALVPGVERVAFFHTGGEAVAAAVRLARAVTARPRFAKFEGCYHGSNEVGLHNTWLILSGRPPFGALDDIPPFAATGGMRTDPDALVLPFNSPVAFELLRRHAKDVACLVVDPIPPFLSNWPDECRAFLGELVAVAREAEVPLVFDEVVCGFRIAPGGAREWLGAAPALSCFGKITSGLGIPLSVVAGEAALVDAWRTSGLFRDYVPAKAWLSSTLSCNFPAVVAALAQLRHLRERHAEVLATLDRNHAELRERFADCAARTGIPLSLQGHPRLQMQLAVGKPTPSEHSFRGVMAATSQAQMRILLALPLYLRLEGVYAKCIPTLNLSAAHGPAELERVATGVERALVRMQRDGMLDTL